eukprot:scaffold1344_cov388-Prasinococcus_capsulatus_cf.AAC.10
MAVIFSYSSSVAWITLLRTLVPALLTRQLSLPSHRVLIAFSNFARSSLLERSAGKPHTLAPLFCCCKCSTVLSTSAASRPFTITEAPSATNSSAVASPMPCSTSRCAAWLSRYGICTANNLSVVSTRTHNTAVQIRTLVEPVTRTA